MLDGRLDPDLIRLLAPRTEEIRPLPRWLARLLTGRGRE